MNLNLGGVIGAIAGGGVSLLSPEAAFFFIAGGAFIGNFLWSSTRKEAAEGNTDFECPNCKVTIANNLSDCLGCSCKIVDAALEKTNTYTDLSLIHI